MEIIQNELVLVNLDRTIGTETRKTRTYAVISHNEINHNLNTIIVAPMTSTERIYPARIKVYYDDKSGYIVTDQIRTIENK